MRPISIRSSYRPHMVSNYPEARDIDDTIYTFKQSVNNSKEHLYVYPNPTIYKQIRLWLHKLATLDHTSPTFIYNDLTSCLLHTIEHTSKYDLYIAYIPPYWLEPAHIGCFKYNPELKILNIEKICSNPFMGFYTLKSFKKSLHKISNNTSVKLNIQPLCNYAHQRYFLDFRYFP